MAGISRVLSYVSSMTDLTFRSDFTVDLVDSMGGDDSILKAMLISTLKDESVDDMGDSGKFGRINFLMKNRHGTPFEHNSMTFRVEAPIFVFREWHRHRIGCCVAGDAIVDFVNINGTRAPRICKTMESLWQRWEQGEIVGRPSQRLEEALELVSAGASVRAASTKTGVARGTIDRHREELCLPPGQRGSRWRIEGMRVRVMDETTGRFTHSTVNDVIRSGIKEIITLNIGPTSLKLTPDHLVWTPDGWQQAGSLRRGSLVARPGKIAAHPRQIPPRLREGIGLWTERLRDELIENRDTCYLCTREFPRKNLVLDHIVPVVQNLSLALTKLNLAPCCHRCHRHKTNGEQSLATRGTVVGARFEPLIQDLRSAGKTMTYDLSINDHHNFVANGLVVHNSINEQSGRYVELPPMFYVPPEERALKQVGKPGAYEYIAGTKSEWATTCEYIETTCSIAYQAYEAMLDCGVAKEVARMCLPVNIYSSMYWTCNARSLMAFLSLRTRRDPYFERPDGLSTHLVPNPGGAMFPSKPMWEIDQCAQAMETFFSELFPITYDSFNTNGRICP